MRNTPNTANCHRWRIPLRRRRRCHLAGSSQNAAKTKMAGGGIYRLGHARGWAIAAAIIGRAKEGAAFHHLAWDFHARQAWIKTVLPSATARVAGAAACSTRL